MFLELSDVVNIFIGHFIYSLLVLIPWENTKKSLNRASSPTPSSSPVQDGNTTRLCSFWIVDICSSLFLSMSHLQFILFLVPIVSGESFNLTYRRDENKFYLTCDVQNDSIDVSQVNFWINQTERIDISIRSERIFLSYNNIIVFELEPQYEGTFYCGTDSGGQSNGLGPFAGKIKALYSSKFTLLVATAYPTDPQGIHNWYTVLTGENITLQCPFQLGALFQSYQVYWAPPNIVPDQYELGLSDDKYPLLTIANFQPPNSGIYDCHINITSPYDKLNWNVEGSVEARIALGSTHLDASDITGISFATFATIFALCALCCCCFCCCFPEATSLSPIIKGMNIMNVWPTLKSSCTKLLRFCFTNEKKR